MLNNELMACIMNVNLALNIRIMAGSLKWHNVNFPLNIGIMAALLLMGNRHKWINYR
jgi:hypothetical protein